jgi:uncharacterized protein (DUF2062 family)
VNADETSLTEATPKDVAVPRGLFYRRAVLPVLALLRMGASPERLAWSIAAGAVIGISPLLGSTTILCLTVAVVFRLNIAASQLGNHIVYPLELLLVIPFLRLGSIVFRTPPVPLSPAVIMQTARHHPIELIKVLWLWEWHALILWAALSVVLMPLIAFVLTPLLRRLMPQAGVGSGSGSGSGSV